MMENAQDVLTEMLQHGSSRVKQQEHEIAELKNRAAGLQGERDALERFQSANPSKLRDKSMQIEEEMSKVEAMLEAEYKKLDKCQQQGEQRKAAVAEQKIDKLTYQ